MPSNPPHSNTQAKMKPTYSNIPLEIRRKIYSCLLSEQNAPISCTSDRRLHPHFCTSLFALNKSLSSESLDYFYTTNAFILVETNAPLWIKGLKTRFPLLVTSNLKNVECFPLQVQIFYARSPTLERIGWKKEKAYGVLAAEHLENFMKFLLLTQREWTYYMSFHFNLEGGWFHGKEKVKSLVVASVQGVKRVDDNILNLTITGDLDDESLQALKNSYSTPLLTLREILDEAKAAIEKGDGYFQKDIYHEAFRECCLALLIMMLFDEEFEGCPNMVEEFTLLRINNYVNLSMVDSKQGRWKTAGWIADRAFEEIEGDESISSELHAKVMFSLGCAFAEGRMFWEAGQVLKEGLKFAPGDETITKKLQEVESREEMEYMEYMELNNMFTAHLKKLDTIKKREEEEVQMLKNMFAAHLRKLEKGRRES